MILGIIFSLDASHPWPFIYKYKSVQTFAFRCEGEDWRAPKLTINVELNYVVWDCQGRNPYSIQYYRLKVWYVIPIGWYLKDIRWEWSHNRFWQICSTPLQQYIPFPAYTFRLPFVLQGYRRPFMRNIVWTSLRADSCCLKVCCIIRSMWYCAWTLDAPCWFNRFSQGSIVDPNSSEVNPCVFLPKCLIFDATYRPSHKQNQAYRFCFVYWFSCYGDTGYSCCKVTSLIVSITLTQLIHRFVCKPNNLQGKTN